MMYVSVNVEAWCEHAPQKQFLVVIQQSSL